MEEDAFKRMSLGFACVCSVIDEDLRDFVAVHGSPGACDMCGKPSHVVWIADLFERMGHCIRNEFEVASASTNAPGPEWEADPNPIDSESLLYDLGEPISDALVELFAGYFEEDWIAEDVWSGPYATNLLLSWDEFCTLVRERMRFVFLGEAGTIETFGPGPSNALATLEAVAEMLAHSDAIVSLPSGQQIFRARRRHKSIALSSASELGPPPSARAKPMRMNPVGISYFYGASDVQTCLAEARGSTDEVATVGTWLTVQDQMIVDLCHLPETPGFFDLEGKRRRAALDFVTQFAHVVSRPAFDEAAADVNYIPTQILAEYLRYVVRSKGGDPIAGIRYDSSLSPGRENIVLFIDSSRCFDASDSADDAVVVLTEVAGRFQQSAWLSLDVP